MLTLSNSNVQSIDNFKSNNEDKIIAFIHLGVLNLEEANKILDKDTKELVIKLYNEILKEKCEYCGNLRYNVENNQGPGMMYGLHCMNMINGIKHFDI